MPLFLMEDPEERNPCLSSIGVDCCYTIADYMVPCSSSAQIGILSGRVEVVDPSLLGGFCTKSSLILIKTHITPKDIMK